MAKYFVGGLNPVSTTETFRQYFEMFGEIQDAIVMHKDGRSRCFGFVTFSNPELLPPDFTSQLHIIDGKQVDLKDAVPQAESGICKLFLGGLAPSTDTAQLQDYFSQFGTLTDVVAMTVNGQPRGFGFVTYSTPQEADAVLTYPGGHVLDGRILDVKRAEPKGSAPVAAIGAFGGGFGGGFYGRPAPVYGGYRAPAPIRSRYLPPQRFSGPPPGLSDANAFNTSKVFIGGLQPTSTEDTVAMYFSQFGSVTEVQIMRREGLSRGFGFVVFASPAEAAQAIAPHFHSIDGKAVEVKACLPKAAAPPPSRGALAGYGAVGGYVPAVAAYPVRSAGRFVGGLRAGYGGASRFAPRYRPY